MHDKCVLTAAFIPSDNCLSNTSHFWAYCFAKILKHFQNFAGRADQLREIYAGELYFGIFRRFFFQIQVRKRNSIKTKLESSTMKL